MKFAAGICTAVIALLLSGAGYLGGVFAQTTPLAGGFHDGDAVVTGFSGTQPPMLIAPGTEPADKTYIDLAGPSARVVDLPAPGAPPQAQLWPAPKPFSVTAGQVGQVFAVALDSANPPNIYLAATSAYGLPIVVPDKDGDGLPDRVKQGTPNASFMPGLFGPSDQGGGPGSIWRIDGVTGEVHLFANVTLDGAPNSGPALGGLAFDPASNSLFVADRDTGMIHRFDRKGAELGHYDHGVQGRTAAGLPPVPFDPAKRLNIQSPLFQTENPGTWAYAPRPRLIFGLAVRQGRLYYAVADGLQIWSVAITPDGAFGTDARIEITVPPSFGATEISKITFDDQGRMLLAGRAAPTGAYDFAALAQEGVGRVLRYAHVQPAGPPGPTWQPIPDEYAIGFAVQLRNGNGGVAVGYRYDSKGAIDRSTCDGFLWSTGEQLRVSPDPALAAQLAQGGPTIVNGLQGNDIELVAPANVPPLQTYFVDYDDRFDDPAARGHLGDIAIWRICGRAGIGGRPWFGWLGFGVPGIPIPPPAFCPVPGPTGCTCPPGDPTCVCPPGTTQQPGLQCCPTFGQVPGPGGCQSLCANGAADPLSSMECFIGFQPFDYPATPPANATCWDGSAPVNHGGSGGVDGWQCPAPPNPQCPAGWAYHETAGPDPDALWGNADCSPTAQQQACFAALPELQQVGLDGQCHKLCPSGSWAWPSQQCCPVGAVPGPDGNCGPPPPPTACPPSQITSIGLCCPADTTPQPNGGCLSQTCPPDTTMLAGVCCLNSKITSTGICCPFDSSPQPNGQCLPPAKSCPPNTTVNPLTGDCLPPPTGWSACPADWLQKSNGLCCPPPGAVATVGAVAACKCPDGQNFDGQKCSVAATAPPSPTGPLAPITGPSACFTGFVQLPSGACCLRSQVTAGDQCCPSGKKPDANGRTCVPVTPPSIFVPRTRAPSGVTPHVTPEGPWFRKKLPPPALKEFTPPLKKFTLPPRKKKPVIKFKRSLPGVRSQ